MQIRRVLVVFKKSLYDIYVLQHRDDAFTRALKRGDDVTERLVSSHQRQQRAMKQVEDVLARRGIAYVLRWRGQLRSVNGYDLVISVGGDGTVLDTAQRLAPDMPLVGLNSDPETSVGTLCYGSVDKLNALLDMMAVDEISPQQLTRIQVSIDGKPTLGPCLNDILFAHGSPAEMSRFEMLGPVPSDDARRMGKPDAPKHDGWRAVRNSGLWVCTATGSTGAMRSAGGRVMRPASKQLQYRIREPYSLAANDPSVPMAGFIRPGEALVLKTRMRSAKIWGDGVHRRVKVEYGQHVLIERHANPLRLYR